MPERRKLRAPGVLLLLGCTAFAAPVSAQFTPEGYEYTIATVRCDCGCHPQSLKACACGYAAEKRAELLERMQREDLTGEAMVATLIAENPMGEQLLISPPKSGFNLVAWLGPLAALLVAIAAVGWLLVRWRARDESAAATAATATAAPAADDPYMARLQRELQELE